MPKRVVDLRAERPLLDIASLGRRGPEARLTPSEVASIARTARRVPEVMIEVSGGARTLHGVGAHFDYIGRQGLNEIETDMDERLMERGFEKDLMLEWDLDLDVLCRHTDRSVAYGRKPPKLVHNLIFSMPKGTPSDKLAAAVRAFSLNRFALQHRYAMALHTHQGNPHVHLVVRAVSEQGVRLDIRKATLRDWRQQFAAHLREQGIAANATERAVRGATRVAKVDGVFRSDQRDSSTYVQAKFTSYVRRAGNGAAITWAKYRTEVLPLKRSANTRADQAKQLAKLKAVFGDMPPDKITAQHCYKYLDGRAQHPVAARHEISLLGHVLDRKST